MKKTSFLVSLIGIYLAIIGCVWIVQTRSARHNLAELAQVSVDAVIDTLDYNVEPEEFRVARLLVYEWGAVSNAVTADVAGVLRRFDFDEINVVDKNGIIVASGNPQSVGEPFFVDGNPDLEAYAGLASGKAAYVAQHFRPSVEAKDGAAADAPWRKYIGLPFPGGGFLQIGESYRDFRGRFGSVLERLMNDYQAGENGFYLLVDRQQGDIVSGFTPEMHGLRLTDAGIDPGAFKSDDDILAFTVFDLPAFVRRVRIGFAEMDVYVVLSREDVFQTRNHAVGLSALVLALVFLVGGGLFLKVMQQHALVERLRAEEDKKRERDIKMASNIQLAALPTAYPDEPALDMFAIMRTAKEVGGDFYDFMILSDRKLFIVCADVSDKGIPAAMFMMKSKAVLRAAVEAHADLQDAVSEANAALCVGNDESTMFVTAWVAKLDLDSGRIEYVNAGHNPPLLRRADGSVEYLRDRHGLVLAATDVARYRSSEVQLGKGDMLFLYTDGVTEATASSGGFFGETRLAAFLKTAKDDAKGVCEGIVSEVGRFACGAPQSDDITVLSVRYLGAENIR